MIPKSAGDRAGTRLDSSPPDVNVKAMFRHFAHFTLIALASGAGDVSAKESNDGWESLVTPLPISAPRPTSVTGVAAPLISLNGEWRFSADGTAGGDSPPIRVPGEWAMQGFKVSPGKDAEYLKTFEIPADWSGKSLRLRFDAVHSQCSVTLNGVPVGGHEGGFVPFELDVTAAAKPGERNELRVKVRSESLADTVACLSQYAGHPVGGIVRKAAVYALPKIHAIAQDTVTTFDSRYVDAKLAVVTTVRNAGDLAADARLDLELTDPAGKVVAGVRNRTLALPAGAGVEDRVSLPVSAPSPWTNETPALYTLRTTVRSAAGEETFTRRVGFRQIEVRGNRLFVNGRAVKLLGVCRHEVDPLTGRSVSPELCREDAKLFREGNCNFVRTSHYPPSEEFLDACDETGLFVESEAAVCWIKHHASPYWKNHDHLAPAIFPYLLRANLDNVAANRSHPSVILWSTANESLWTPLFAKVDEVVRRADPSRPTTFHDQCWGSFNNASSRAQIAVYHYPGENNPEVWSGLDRPSYFGEYAHVQCYNRRELATDPGIRADWGRPLARMTALMYSQPGCAGGAIWSGIDDVFHLPGGDIVGYGNWGVIDGWRRKKPEWFGMQKAYAPVLFKALTSDSSGSARVRIENRRAFVSVKSFGWVCGDRSGTVETDIAPGASLEITLPFAATQSADSVTLSTSRAGGGPAHRATLAFGKPLSHPVPADAQNTGVPQVVENTTEIVVTLSTPSGVLRHEFDKRTGKLRIGRNGRIVLDGAVSPMVLPLNGDGGAAGPAGSTFVNIIEAFTPVCAPVSPVKVTPARSGDTVTVTVRGEYDAVSGETRFVFAPRQSLKIEYDYGVKQPVDPRQWGLVFALPRAFDTLRWRSPGGDAGSDPHDIARPDGIAKASPSARRELEEPGRDLTGTSWADDANALGSNDFRSTKTGADLVTLDDGVLRVGLAGGGFAATRTWVDGDSVRLLAAGFNTGGADSFFSPHYAAERRPLKAGERIRGVLTLFAGDLR